MDKECERLCNAMNLYPGIETYESCCGHGDRSFCIWFTAESLDVLPNLIYWFVACHSGCNWPVCVKTDCTAAPATFFVEGPVGEKAYEQAEIIAECLENDIKEGGE